MRIPIIKIREQSVNRVTERLVGTNSHDELYVDNGGIYYLNVQGMVGTKYPDESGITFVTREPDDFEPCPTIEFVSVDKFLDILKEQIERETDREIEVQKSLKKIMAVLNAEKQAKKKLEDYDKNEGFIPHT